ncbi:MAG: Trk system potassium transporter TrkA [Clostridia bacterium]|nr:Trk system potassium transporter TrkA [Clostridia bacterium]
MNLVIIGAGKVGETLIENFVKESHDITVVDANPATVQYVVNRYDVMGVVGSAVERQILLDAGVDKADFFIANTSRDEMNILCCVLARKLGAKRTIARVRDPEYFKEMENMREFLGLDFAFNPELNTAVEISQVLKFPSAKNVENFAGGRARMAEFDILEGNPVIGKTLKEISKEFGNKVLFGIVSRGEKVYIPHGDFVVEQGDVVYIIAPETELIAFCKKIKIFKPRAKSVFIIGGGKIAYYLSKELLSSGVSVKIVENDKERAEELSELLPSATILLGDGTDHELLEEESIKHSDACITLTGMDEENVIISLYAKQCGVEKSVTKVDRSSVLNMVKMLGLDTVVSPRMVIANDIIRFVRANQNVGGGGINTLYKIHEQAEAIEFTVSENFSAKDMPLKNIAIKENVLIGGIVRGDEFILPSGDSKIKVGDRVIIVTEQKQIAELSEILK